jgi:glutamyl-tRNA reductase
LSVPSVAVDEIRRACPELSRACALVVGSGDMSRQVCQYLADAGVSRLLVASRTFNNAKALADACAGVAVPYAELETHLMAADVVVTATACPTAIVTEERVRRAVAGRTPGSGMLLVDLSVPRNIDPGVGKIPGVALYDIDSLADVVMRNERCRAAAVRECEAIIDEEVRAFARWIEEARVAPVINQVYRDAREMAEIEVRRLFNRCPELSDGEREGVTQLVDRLVAKFMHPCVSAIRQGAGEGAESGTLVQAFRAMRLTFTGEGRGGCTHAT